MVEIRGLFKSRCEAEVFQGLELLQFHKILGITRPRAAPSPRAAPLVPELFPVPELPPSPRAAPSSGAAPPNMLPVFLHEKEGQGSGAAGLPPLQTGAWVFDRDGRQPFLACWAIWGELG